jgi:hypothetical protein
MQPATRKLQATKMSEATVSFISLVGNAANRIPFKIIKSEKPNMSKNAFGAMDLGSIFSTKKAEKPVVLAVACMKGDHLEALTAQLKEAGFAVDNMAEHEDGSVVFKQGDAELVAGEKTTVIRLNEDVALVTKGFSPYHLEYAENDAQASFADTCAAQGFYPGVDSVMRTMGDMFRSTVSKSTDPKDAATAVSKMFDDAKAYALSMVKGLPIAAFKMDGVVIAKHAKKEPEMSAEDKAAADAAKEKATKDEADTADAAAAAEAAITKAAETPAEGTDTGEAAAAVAKADATPDVAALVTTEVAKASATLSASLENMLAGITGTIQKSLGEVSDQMAAMQAQVVKAESAAAQATAAVNGTVVIGSALGDHIAKKDATPEYRPREIDTAYQPGIRKQAGKR